MWWIWATAAEIGHSKMDVGRERRLGHRATVARMEERATGDEFVCGWILQFRSERMARK
jgi:hypothetical protein